MELLDLYTEDNIPLGITKPRSEVHANLAVYNHWHRISQIWVFNDKKEILCQKRSMKKDNAPGKWQSVFGGHMTIGETPEESMVRELYEEIGIQIKSELAVFLGVVNRKALKHIVYAYVLHSNKNATDFSFNDNEVDEVKWLPMELVKEKILAKEFANSYNEAVFEYIQSFSA